MSTTPTRALADRLEERLAALGLTPRRASVKAGLPVDGVRNILRAARSDKPYHPRTDTIQKLAQSLETSAAWLLTGEQDPQSTKPGGKPDDSLTIKHSLLREAVMFVLVAEGVPEDRAELIADIFPVALAGPPVEVVERDPFLSFRVHLQLQEQSAHREPR